MSNNEHKVSVLMTAFNEDEALRKTIKIILETCNHDDLEEIFIIAGRRATPECHAALDELTSSNGDVRIRAFYQSYEGPGANLNEFWDLVKGTHFVTIAADGELNPYQISEFVEQSKEKPEYMIVGSRRLSKDGFKDYDLLKKVLNFGAGIFLRVLFVTRRTEFTQPFFAAPCAVFKAINWEEQYHPIFMELLLKPLRLGIKTVEVPTAWIKRNDGKPNRGALYFIPYLKTALRIRFMKKEKILRENRGIPEKYIY